METEVYIQFLAALLFVLGLIGIFALLVRRFGFGLISAPRSGNGKKRIAVVEVIPVDAKRRLALVRRDGTEHLVLLGPTSDLLIESGIKAESPTNEETDQSHETGTTQESG
ncbi:MAG: FliO/MopB family protein [Alphaproteobacteria bacterium]|nr:FliO/MopB family protein [Alphaproteobacteria bacterium]